LIYSFIIVHTLSLKRVKKEKISDYDSKISSKHIFYLYILGFL